VIGLDLILLKEFIINFSIQFGLVILTLFIATKGRRFITQFNPNMAHHQKNRAVIVSTIGYYTSIAIIILSAVSGVSLGYFYDIVSTLSILLLGFLFLALNRWFINLLYLNEFNPKHELERENIAFALFQSGGFLATSIIFYHSFAGFEFNLGLLFVGSTYFILTQLLLLIFVKIFILKTPYDDILEIQRSNLAVAIEFFSLFLALSILFGNVAEAVLDIDLTSIATLLIYFTISSIFLIYVPTLITSLITSGDGEIDRAIADGNIVVAVKGGAVKVIIAIVVVSTMSLSIVIS
jgi:uncharacterized membrane protein YjfL (UPF0719 family)